MESYCKVKKPSKMTKAYNKMNKTNEIIKFLLATAITNIIPQHFSIEYPWIFHLFVISRQGFFFLNNSIKHHNRKDFLQLY